MTVRAPVTVQHSIIVCYHLHNVVSKLIREFDSSHTRIVANSYGAYLCLHGLIDAPSYLRHFLLLSPTIGAALNKQSLTYSRMPGCQKYDRAVSEKRLTKPGSLAIHKSPTPHFF